jgi:hypothetical protein
LPTKQTLANSRLETASLYGTAFRILVREELQVLLERQDGQVQRAGRDSRVRQDFQDPQSIQAQPVHPVHPVQPDRWVRLEIRESKASKASKDRLDPRGLPDFRE